MTQPIMSLNRLVSSFQLKDFCALKLLWLIQPILTLFIATLWTFLALMHFIRLTPQISSHALLLQFFLALQLLGLGQPPSSLVLSVPALC
jgi:hypothetical protein